MSQHEPSPMELPPPPPPRTAPMEAWASAPPRRRRTGLVVGALVVVLALVAGFTAFAVLGGDEESAQAQPLALAFTVGQSETYTLHMTMDGTASAGALLGGDQPLDMEVTEVFTWTVTDVDDEGVATITMTVDDVSGTVNGVPMPAGTGTPPSIDIRIAPDGRVLEAGGLSLAGVGQTGGAAFPGMDQMTPLLPDHPVEPGDTWTTDFEQDFPFGDGTISYTATSTLERYEDVDGTRAAVVTTEMTVPLDFTIDLGRLMAAMGDTQGLPPDAEALEDARFAYGGEGSATQTAWVDLEAGRTLRTTSSGSVDMTVAFEGIDELEGQELTLTADFTQDLTRGRTSTGSA